MNDPKSNSIEDCPISRAWLRDNRRAIEAHNERIERVGMLITAPWVSAALAAGKEPKT